MQFTFSTKYKFLQPVWVMKNNKLCIGQIVSFKLSHFDHIVTSKSNKKEKINFIGVRYTNSVGNQDTDYFHESEVFESKEAVVEKLINS